MSQITATAKNAAFLNAYQPMQNFPDPGQLVIDTSDSQSKILIAFNPTEESYKVITSCQIGVQIPYFGVQSPVVRANVLTGYFDPFIITFANAPAELFGAETQAPVYSQFAQIVYDPAYARQIAQNGIAVQCKGCSVIPAGTALALELDDSYEVTGYYTDFSPGAGSSAIAANDLLLTWKFNQEDLPTLLPIEPVSGYLQWREVGGTIRSIALTNVTSAVIPKNTLPLGDIEYRVMLNLNNGAEDVTSEWIQIHIGDTPAVATPTYPVGEIVDGSEDIVFKWQYSTASGTAQKKFELQTSSDAQTWTTRKTEETERQYWGLPAGTLGVGEHYWRIRTYNQEGTAGEWSAASKFVVMAAPDVPIITISDNSPHFALRWQQEGQQAYEIRIDDRVIAKKFGTESNYQYPVWMPAGRYTVTVRIQNRYGLWSEWAAAQLPIENTEEEPIELSVYEGKTAELTWTENGADRYAVYKNGEMLAVTQNTSFEDPFCEPNSTYFIRGIDDDTNNFTQSNSVSALPMYKCLSIFDVENSIWIELLHSDVQVRQTNKNVAAAVSYFGTTDELPYAETGIRQSRTWTITCAFGENETEAKEKFEKLPGKTVCVKDQNGNAMIGIVDSISKTQNIFYAAYQANLTECAFDAEEYYAGRI